MGEERRKITKKEVKCILFVILLVISIWNTFSIFVGLAGFGMELEFWFFYAIPATILTPIIYGIASYLITKKILIPHLLIFVIWFIELLVIYCLFGELDTIQIVAELLCISGIVSVISLGISAITKLISKKVRSDRDSIRKEDL